MSIIDAIQWYICRILAIIISIQIICIFLKNLTKSQRYKLIRLIISNKKPSLSTSTPASARTPPPPPQFTLGMDVKEWTNTFLFYITENNIEKNKRNELLLSKLEPFCQSLISDHLFDDKDQDIAFEQHILLMNKLFESKKHKHQPKNKTSSKIQHYSTFSNNRNSSNKNMRDLIPGFTLPNLVKCV